MTVGNSVIFSPQINLKPNTNYVVEFDYWADSDNTQFRVDLHPDDLPEVSIIANRVIQHYKWELSSSSSNMANSYLRFFCGMNVYITNIKLSEPSNIVTNHSISDSTFYNSSPYKQGVCSITAIKLLNGNSVIFSSQINLKPNTNYIVEFDYWSDTDNITFGADLYPDDLPEVLIIAHRAVQHYRWELSSSSSNMANSYLRFWGGPGVYITNIKIYEQEANNDNVGYKFTGKLGDDSIGLIYFGARWYDPEVGRFLTQDPVKDGLNWYAYCNNNPLRFTDPDGRIPLDTIADVGFLIWDVGRGIFGDKSAWVDVGLDAAGLVTPYVPGQAYKALRYGAKALNKADNIVDLVKSGERVVGTYKNLTKITAGTELQAHHLIEQRFKDVLGVKSGDMLAVALTKEQHQVYTNRWREAIGYIKDYSNYSKEQITEAAKRVYYDAPDLLKIVEEWGSKL